MNELVGKSLHFDCFSGLAGDMVLGALLDVGVDEEFVRAELAKLPVGGYRLERTRVKRGALMGCKIHVHIDAHHHSHDHVHQDDRAHGHHHGQHAHRPYRVIRQVLTTRLDGDVRARSLAILDRIAAVEAQLHGTTVEEVAFHEVGAVDSIVDIVGVAAALAWLAPARVTCRVVPLGGGSVETAHGRLPVPAPATLALLTGVPVEAGGTTELTTPTGAAIVAAMAHVFGDLPAMRVLATGWGAGDRELADRPNLLRVVVGEEAGALTGDQVVIVETNLDDMNPQWCAPLLDQLFAAGALDAWVAPIVMKKGARRWRCRRWARPRAAPPSSPSSSASPRRSGSAGGSRRAPFCRAVRPRSPPRSAPFASRSPAPPPAAKAKTTDRPGTSPPSTTIARAPPRHTASPSSAFTRRPSPLTGAEMPTVARRCDMLSACAGPSFSSGVTSQAARRSWPS